MATTTNFGWETPDDTDLVKDGAAAMRTLGNSIDASFVDLKGGTTGQVLSKNSNTDLDFTWVAQDDSNAIQNAIVDAKGDLIAASAADTPARLAVGNNGEQLLADSSATTGLRWTATPSASNPVLNSSFDIWQRGTSVAATASSASFQADRWNGYSVSANFTVSRQSVSDTTNLPNIQYAARCQRTAGNTATGAFALSQSFETSNSIPFAGKTVTFSFYARAGANYSQTSSKLDINLFTGTGTDQNIQQGYTGAVALISQQPTLTTTWQRFTYTGTVATNVTEIAVQFVTNPTGTAGANDWFEVTGVQIDIGSVALPFRRSFATLAGELAACQRYYWRTGVQSAYGIFGNGSASSTTNCKIIIKNPSTLRVKAASVDYSTLATFDGSTVTAITNVVVDGNQTTPDYSEVDCTVASGLTQFRPYFLLANASGSAYIGFSAEL